MNKKNLRAAGWALCLAMAVAGIGAAVGASFITPQEQLVETRADDVAVGSAVFNATNNQSNVGNYTSTWTNITNGLSWSIANFNNNNSAWDYIKTGNKTSASVGTITTASTITQVISKVEISISALTSSNVNSITLKVNGESIGTFSKATGNQSVVIPEAKRGANKTYQIAFDCKKGSSNGLVTVTGVKLYRSTVSATGVAIARGSSSSIPGAIEEKTVTVNKGTGTIAEDLTATVTPDNAEIKTVTWSVGGDNAGFVDWDNATKGDNSLQFNFDVNAVGTFTITASANGGTDVTDVVTYYVIDPTVAKLVSVSVSGTPTKPYQNAGAAFDASGLTFTAHYDDESSKEIAAGDINWDVLVAGEKPSGTYSEAGKNAEIVIDSVTVINKVLVTASTDKITFDDTGLPSTGDKTYTVWSDVKLNDAIYKGKTCAGVSYLQLRTSDATSGIVSTTSGGYLISVSVEWNSISGNDRFLDVYGKNGAYAATGELYDEEAAGEKAGSILRTGSTLAIAGEYTYVGVRSNDSAIYLDSITFEWGEVSEASDVVAVNDFIASNMHLENLDDESGKCKSEGWYSAAKTAFAGLSEAQKEIILGSASEYKVIDAKSWKYSDIKARLSAWATANGESFDPNTGAFTKNTAKNVFFEENSKTGAIVSLAAVAGIGLIATGVLFLLRKKKEEK